MAGDEAIIYGDVGADRAVDRIVRERGGAPTTFVAVPDESVADRVAVELVDDGVQAIELCGGMGPIPAAKVIEAVGRQVPVGSILYGRVSIAGAAGDEAVAEEEAAS